MRYVYLLWSVLFLVGCGTTTPNFPGANEISYGTSGFRDAGVEGQVIDIKTGAHMVIIDKEDRLKFNNDVVKYGSFFNPPLFIDKGIVPYKDAYVISNESLADFAVLRSFERRDAGKEWQ